jgi:hypothetical protein
MDRACGWVELVGMSCPRRPVASASRLARVRRLLVEARGPGWTARLGEADGRWHVWIAAEPDATTVGMLPFFKALGSVAPRACGVLDQPGGTRWVMAHGSVDLVRDTDRAPTY